MITWFSASLATLTLVLARAGAALTLAVADAERLADVIARLQAILEPLAAKYQAVAPSTTTPGTPTPTPSAARS